MLVYAGLAFAPPSNFLQMKIKFLLLLLAGNYLATAQLVSPVLLGSSTGEGNLPNAHIFWTCGELSVATLTNATNQITQGFWQPEVIDLVSSVNGPLQTEYGIECWPNPVSNTLQITFNFGNPVDIALFSLDGRLIFKESSVTSGHVLSMAPWPASMYLLRFTTTEGDWILTQKIIKQ